MKVKKHIILTAVFSFFVMVLSPQPVFAMHIMEGFLPPVWAAFWFVVSIPFIVMGIKSIKKITDHNPNMKMLLGLCGAFAFVLSALKLPSVTGSSSHPTGVGLGAILFGPTAASVLSLIVLLFQAVLLAHGGLTTLGANVFSMGIAGPFASFAVYKLLKKSGASQSICVFSAAALGDLITYVVTSVQLGIAFPTDAGMFAAITKFLGIFAVTQIPLAISEGLLTVVIYNILTAYNQQELEELSFAREGK
ncbi:MAG: energy-coupling factor ABC transporter permease [Bacillota bacterium]